MKYIYQYEKDLLKSKLGTLYSVFKREEVIIAGGAILSLFSNKPVEDYDIYFRNNESAGNLYFSFESYAILSHSKKSVLLANKENKYNLILFKYFDTAQGIFDSFDFTVCMCAFDFKTETFVFDERFHKDIIGRKLIYSATNEYPIGTILRIKKYEEKGFKIARKEVIKIALKIANLEINTLEDVEDHIQGLYGIDLQTEWNKQELGEFSKEKLFNFIDTVSSINIENEKGEFIGKVSDEFCIDTLIEYHQSENKDSYDVNLKIQALFYSFDFIKNLKVFKIKNKYYLFDKNAKYMLDNIILNGDIIEYLNIDEEKIPEINYVYVYKYIEKRDDGTLYSFYQKDFQYLEKTFIEPANKAYYSSGIYTSIIGENPSKYGNESKAVLIQLVGKVEDQKNHNCWNKVFFNKIIDKDIDLNILPKFILPEEEEEIIKYFPKED